MTAKDKPQDLMRNMLLGQHSVSFTAEYTGLPRAKVQAAAEQLHAQKRVPRVRP
jgi:hypothetical protein